VTYDIVSDKTRDKVADCLKDFGDRVQLSVFETDLEAGQFRRMVSRLEKLIDKKTDSVRIYPLCSACLEKAAIIGRGEFLKDPDVIVL
jgi:CRISPR-associated protein Cas2